MLRSSWCLGCHQLPVRIARGDIAFKGPDIGHFADLFQIAINDVASLGQGGGDQFTDEFDGDRGLAAIQAGRIESCRTNADKALIDFET